MKLPVTLLALLLCACSSSPEPAPLLPGLQGKHQPDFPAYSGSRSELIQLAARECSRILVYFSMFSSQEQAHELSAKEVEEMKHILSKVQPMTDRGGLCATPGTATRLEFQNSRGASLASLQVWEIAEAYSDCTAYHCTLALPGDAYHRFQELLPHSDK